MAPVALPPLVPGVKIALPREFDPNAADADHEYGLVRLRILTRDHFTCRSCGFQAIPDRTARSTSLAASGYLHVHHLDNHHEHNGDDNLVTQCPFCHEVHHLGFAATRGARVVMLPWISQEQVSLIVNLAGVARMRQGGELTKKAAKLYEHIQEMTAFVPEVYGIGAEDCEAWAGALALLQRRYPKLYTRRTSAMRNLRVIPDLDYHKDALAWWSEHSWLPGKNWEQAWVKLAG